MGENDDFQPLHPEISRNSQTVIMRPQVLLTIDWKFAVDFFARGLHTRTAVARLPLRQLGFLVYPILHRFRDTMTQRSKIAAFRTPFYLTPVLGVSPFELLDEPYLPKTTALVPSEMKTS